MTRFPHQILHQLKGARLWQSQPAVLLAQRCKNASMSIAAWKRWLCGHPSHLLFLDVLYLEYVTQKDSLIDKSQIRKINALQAATTGNCVAGKAEGRSTTFRCPQAPAKHEVRENGTSDTAMCGDSDVWVSSTTDTSPTTNCVIMYNIGTYVGKASRTPGSN